MERIAWDIHHVLCDLEALPGALVTLPKETQRHQNEANAAAHRRALRRLDRSLQQLESQILRLQEQHQQQQEAQLVQQFVQKPSSDIHQSSDAQKHIDQNQTQDDSATIRTLILSQQDKSLSPRSSQLQATENTASATMAFSDPLKADLCVILTRLAIPMRSQEDTIGIGQLAVSIVQRVANLWILVTGESNELLSANDVIAMLHRLFECREIDHHDPSGNGNDVNSSLFWAATLAWLSVLNTHFMRIDDRRGEMEPVQPAKPPITLGGFRGFGACDGETSGDDFFVSSAGMRIHSELEDPASLSITGGVGFQFLPEMLRLALEMVQLTPWEPVLVGDVASEARVQWRILTGYLIEHTIQLQQEEAQVPGHSTSPVQWLHDRFHGANLTLPSDVIMNAVYKLLSILTTYVTDLTDYALDALDGAAVSFSSTTSPFTCNQSSEKHPGMTIFLPGDGINGDESCCNEQTTFDLEAAESAVQDSLRHVTLATNALAAVEPWCAPAIAEGNSVTSSHANRLRQIQQQQLVRLWKTMAASFMAKSNFKTVFHYNNYSGEVNHSMYENDLASRVCHHQLQLADLVLSSSSLEEPVNATGIETTLTLTFLRALEFPEQLLYAARLWEAVTQRMQKFDCVDLKRTLQASVLTLRQQHLLHGDVRSLQQQGALAIVDRLLPLLLKSDNETQHQGQWRTDGVAWDGFFVRQIGFPATGPTI